MSVDAARARSRPVVRAGVAAVAASLALGGCAGVTEWACGEAPPPRVQKLLVIQQVRAAPAPDLLDYRRRLRDLSGPELEWERMLLTAEPQFPETRVRLAMVLGALKREGYQERALELLDGVRRADTTEAVGLQPLAGWLVEQYQAERRYMAAVDKLGQEISRLNAQVRASQMRAEMLQQKLDVLVDIEHTLPSTAAGPARRR